MNPQNQSVQRRRILQASVLIWLMGAGATARSARVLAVRLWPAEDYTRVTIESDGALKAPQATMTGPTMFKVDIEGVDLAAGLRDLLAQLKTSDPNIASIRVNQGSDHAVELMFELKQPIRPQIFNLQPVAAYRHRLVLDLYPLHAVDPLEQLISQRVKEIDQASERAARLLNLEIDELVSKSQPDPAPNSSVPDAPADTLGSLIAQRDRPNSPPAPPQTQASAPAPRAETSSPRPTAPKPSPKAQRHSERLIIVALDPGHGGEDPGAIGPGGTAEKDVVLQIALRLRERINTTRVNGNPMRAYLTRDADFFVPLEVRVQKAQRVQADLFISLHADAFYTPRPQGASVFALSNRGASSAAARWMANKENQADLVGGINVKTKDTTVQRALLDMSTTAQINDSIKLGRAVLGEVGLIGKLHKSQVEQAGFAVLKAPDIPSVLVETAFISNADEEKRLKSVSYQSDLADALLKAIVRYFSQKPPLARTRSI